MPTTPWGYSVRQGKKKKSKSKSVNENDGITQKKKKQSHFPVAGQGASSKRVRVVVDSCDSAAVVRNVESGVVLDRGEVASQSLVVSLVKKAVVNAGQVDVCLSQVAAAGRESVVFALATRHKVFHLGDVTGCGCCAGKCGQILRAAAEIEVAGKLRAGLAVARGGEGVTVGFPQIVVAPVD